MGRADHTPRPADHREPADCAAIDLILACERAASGRNPRNGDPARWNKTAWRRYLYAAAHAASGDKPLDRE